MSVEETERTMRDYIEALVGKGDGDFAAFFADDVLWTTMETGEEVRGRDAVRDLIVSLHGETFHASPELKHLVCGDGLAAIEAVFVATHVSDFAGIPATGAEVRVPYTVFYDVAGGQITALRAYLSMLALTSQLQAAAAVTA